MDTLYLDPASWDLSVDASGNIAVAKSPYAAAQDAASACRLWQGEALFNTAAGIPYKAGILGQMPPRAILSDWFETASLTVPDVVEAVPVLEFSDGGLTGQIQLTLNTGEIVYVGL